MRKIKIFLASSNELKPEGDQFEIEIYRKTKAWFIKGVFLYLDIWEDMTARKKRKLLVLPAINYRSGRNVFRKLVANGKNNFIFNLLI